MAEASGARFSCAWSDVRPCLGECTAHTPFDRHYVYHTAWAARVLAETRPPRHVDVSSCLRFVSVVSAFIPVEHHDLRPPGISLDGLDVRRADLLALPFADASVISLSCMHALEHVGLGRYGDPLDPDGDRKAAAELRRVLAPGGELLLAVPVGGQSRIAFNAHRIYTVKDVTSLFGDLDLVEFALIPDDGSTQGLIRNAGPALADTQRYACGCFRFRKT
nr:DUF268 domain-containing protein [Desulfobaculum xiamenense]